MHIIYIYISIYININYIRIPYHSIAFLPVMTCLGCSTVNPLIFHPPAFLGTPSCCRRWAFKRKSSSRWFPWHSKLLLAKPSSSLNAGAILYHNFTVYYCFHQSHKLIVFNSKPSCNCRGSHWKIRVTQLLHLFAICLSGFQELFTNGRQARWCQSILQSTETLATTQSTKTMKWWQKVWASNIGQHPAEKIVGNAPVPRNKGGSPEHEGWRSYNQKDCRMTIRCFVFSKIAVCTAIPISLIPSILQTVATNVLLA